MPASRGTLEVGRTPKSVRRASSEVATPLTRQLNSLNDRLGKTLTSARTKSRVSELLNMDATNVHQPLRGTSRERVTLERLATRVDGMVSVDLQQQLRGMHFSLDRSLTVC